MLAKLRSLARNLRGRDTFEDAMDAEMRFHLESRTADLVRRGLPPAEAARQARLEFGSIEKQKDEARAGAGLRILDEVTGDVRYALRTFVRNRGFTAAALVTLALGIGANAAIFNLLDALVLRSLPVHRPDQLLLLTMGSPDKKGDPTLSYPMVRALDAERGVFGGVGAFGGATLRAGSGDNVRRVPAAYVTGGYYDTLGLSPAAGRLLTRIDDEPGAPLVAVASYGYWERQFAASPAAIGQTILLNGVAVTIVGVSPRGFNGANVGAAADLTVPVASIDRIDPPAKSLLGRGNSWLRALARFAPGVSPEQAKAKLDAEWPRVSAPMIDPRWPAWRQDSVAKAVVRFESGARGWTWLREIYVKPLAVLMGLVSLVLLVACANVAGLLLARGSARRREFAVRMAIGAGRGRIVRQLLVESLTLAAVGGAGGVVLATIGANFLVGVISRQDAPLVFDLSPNWRVIAFTSAVVITTAILFGLAPALHSTTSGVGPALKNDARTAATRSRLLPALITVQIALSLVLLVGAGLFVRTLRNLQTLDPGFKADGVLLAEFGGRRGPIPAAAVEAVRALPGVISASIATHTPMSGSGWSDPAVPAGQPLPDRDTAMFVGAGPGFFDTMALPILSGRGFNAADTREAAPVAIVNQRYAERYFPRENPVGRHLNAEVNGERKDLEIVGVAGDTKTGGLRAACPLTVYVAYAQIRGSRPSTIAVRTSGSSVNLQPAVQSAIRPLVPDIPFDMRPLSTQVASSLVQERMMATLGSAFGVLALVLASIGVYGLLAYSVARRTREIGIRLALGSQRSGVMALVIGGAWRPLLIGLGVGLPAAWALSRLFASMLFGLTPADPIAIGGATLLLVLVAHAAAWLPARRASRVDPLVALKCE